MGVLIKESKKAIMKNFELVKIFTTLSETSGGGAGGCGGCGGGGGKSNFKDFFRSQKTRIFFAKIILMQELNFALMIVFLKTTFSQSTLTN